MKNTVWRTMVAVFMVLYYSQAFARESQEAIEIEKSQQDIAAEKRMRKRIETPRSMPVIIEDKTEVGENISETGETLTEEPKGGAEK